jgi:restriction system protein
MAVNSRESRREQKRREKLASSAFALAAMGVVLVIVPTVLSNQVLKGAFSNLRPFGLLMMLAGGVGFFLLRRRGASADEPPSSAAAARDAGQPGKRSNRTTRRAEQAVGAPGGIERALDDVLAQGPSRKSTPMQSGAALDERPAVPSVWGPEVFDVIEWRRFEAVCEWLFSQAGFETKTQSHGADGGIDIWLYSKNFGTDPVSVVQCKHWKSKPVKVAEVRALLGSMAHKKVARGIFATTSTFTTDARQFASENKIQLLDRTGLLELIAKRAPEQQQELLAVATKGDFWVPTCASCGIKMVRRTRRADAGTFWGCANFPGCRNTING